MRIGTLTLHRSQNYGGLLQAFALQYVLKALGFTSEIIDYWYPGSNEALHGPTFGDCKTVKSKAMFVVDQLIFSIGSLRGQKLLRRQRSIDFIKKYLSKDSYANYPWLKERAIGYNAYICGSDQVWNPHFRASDEALRLEFVPENCIKISYAASFGVSSLPENQKSEYRAALQRFDHISVREREGVEIVKDVSNRRAKLVLDPTLLLTCDEWLALIPRLKTDERYILCYFLGENDATRNTVYEYQKKCPMPIYTIGYHPSRLFNKRFKMIIDAGPIQFLSLFAGASMVFTNSFHGTVFSTLFKKPFCTFVDTNKSRKQMSSRILSLTNMLGLDERVSGYRKNLDDTPIDYNRVESILSVERKKSIKFLRESLCGACE